VEKFSFLVDDTQKLSTKRKDLPALSGGSDKIPQSPHLLSTSHMNVVLVKLQSSVTVMHFSPRVMTVKELMNERNR
jgi:hypothetical protein